MAVIIAFVAIIVFLFNQNVLDSTTLKSGTQRFSQAGAIGFGVMIAIILFGSIFVSDFWGIKKFHLFLIVIYCFQFLMILGSWELWFMMFNPHGRSLRTPWALPYIIACDLILFVIEGKLIIRINEKYKEEFIYQLSEAKTQTKNNDEANQTSLENSMPPELTNGIDKWKSLIEDIKCQFSLWTKKKKD